MENNLPTEEENINRTIRRKTIVAFSVFALCMLIVIAGWQWLLRQPTDNGVLKPLRTVLDANEKANEGFFSSKNLAAEFPKSAAAKNVRVNGSLGLESAFDPASWQLEITPHPGNTAEPKLNLTMSDILALPKREVIFDFKCIEGWDQISHWGGVKFSDFLLKYKLGTKSGKSPDAANPEDMYKYVGLMTPDGKYYVGIDMKSMMQPQTLLAYEVNEKPLPLEQGFPLRLIIPVKYGIKSLKRIGSIYFSDTRPPDYWFENGYDYDAAL